MSSTEPPRWQAHEASDRLPENTGRDVLPHDYDRHMRSTGAVPDFMGTLPPTNCAAMVLESACNDGVGHGTHHD